MSAPVPSPTRPGPHIPERSCVACRAKRPQGEFLRVARLAGVWSLRAGPRAGRGAYLCADSPTCWAEKRLRRAFGGQAPEVARQLAERTGGSTPPTTMTTTARPMS